MSDDTPWLDSDEGRIWRAYIEATGRIGSQLNVALKASTGMTVDDYEVLVHLSEHAERRMPMTELSDLLLHSQSRLTQRIDRLVKRGFVTREKCPADRRRTFAVLTDEGFTAIAEAAPGHVRNVRDVFVDLIEPHERATILAVFERLALASRNRDQGEQPVTAV